MDDAHVLTIGSGDVWIGLKNGDDVGTRFDLIAEVLLNGAVAGRGQFDNVAGGGSGFNNFRLRSIGLDLFGPVTIVPGDTLGLRLFMRVSASSGHQSGTARLWFDDAAANSRFDVTIDGVAADLFLRNGFAL